MKHLLCFILLTSCAKKNAISPEPILPLECYLTSVSPYGASCTKANLGDSVVPLNLQEMFIINPITEHIQTIGIAIMDKTCVTAGIFDASTQSTTMITQCGSSVDAAKKILVP